MTEKEGLLTLLKENKEEMDTLRRDLRRLSGKMYDVVENYRLIEIGLKRIVNTEKHGNCHINCEYYNKRTDSCYNYMMSTGLSFNVSKLDRCIADVVKEHENDW